MGGGLGAKSASESGLGGSHDVAGFIKRMPLLVKAGDDMTAVLRR